MSRVTRLEADRGRVRVLVDGEEWGEVPAGTLSRWGIREGDEVSPEQLFRYERSLAMDRALRLLSGRDRSRLEICGRLKRFGHHEEVVREVVGRLAEMGYLDDVSFARRFARERVGKGYGRERVLSDLLRRGVGRELAEEAVRREYEGVSDLEEARVLAARRYNTGERSDALARRVHGFLRRRGYQAEVCVLVAREYRGSPLQR
ncbi:regulatory protein RecX [Rubrobacter calidifluminis]|uniref:regulatory protein RecX n=1 Tax=Rubrobacter calidifluminis TaxID=1392640 RepID=UPI002361B9AF|nr:regulatory protein RecX [Rubrobacter calidifluminis]